MKSFVRFSKDIREKLIVSFRICIKLLLEINIFIKIHKTLLIFDLKIENLLRDLNREPLILAHVYGKLLFKLCINVFYEKILHFSLPKLAVPLKIFQIFNNSNAIFWKSTPNLMDLSEKIVPPMKKRTHLIPFSPQPKIPHPLCRQDKINSSVRAIYFRRGGRNPRNI